MTVMTLLCWTSFALLVVAPHSPRLEEKGAKQPEGVTFVAHSREMVGIDPSLKELFVKYQSDKETKHRYSMVYDMIFLGFRPSAPGFRPPLGTRCSISGAR